jgi:hypothetical protein
MICLKEAPAGKHFPQLLSLGHPGGPLAINSRLANQRKTARTAPGGKVAMNRWSNATAPVYLSVFLSALGVLAGLVSISVAVIE